MDKTALHNMLADRFVETILRPAMEDRMSTQQLMVLAESCAKAVILVVADDEARVEATIALFASGLRRRFAEDRMQAGQVMGRA